MNTIPPPGQVLHFKSNHHGDWFSFNPQYLSTSVASPLWRAEPSVSPHTSIYSGFVIFLLTLYFVSTALRGFDSTNNMPLFWIPEISDDITPPPHTLFCFPFVYYLFPLDCKLREDGRLFLFVCLYLAQCLAHIRCLISVIDYWLV